MSTKHMSEVTETPDLQGAYPRLSDAQIDALAALGQRRRTEPGQVLFAEGDRNCDFFVVLAGLVAVVDGRGTPEERVIGVHGRGRFLGELSLLTGEASYYTGGAGRPGEVLVVPVDQLRELVARDPGLRRAGAARLPHPPLDPDRPGRWPRGSSAPGTRRTPGGCATSRPATGCPTGGWTWRPIRPPRRCSASSAWRPRRRRS